MTTPRILIVDDESKLVRLAQELLSATGFDVLAALNGQQTVEMAASEPPDLILLDIMLPGRMDGYQVAQRIRQFSKRTYHYAHRQRAASRSAARF